MKSSRLAAFEILNEVIRNGAYSNLALEKHLSGVDKKDRAFVSALVLGVIERRLTIEYIVNLYLKRRTKPKVKIILYTGVYQLYFMSGVPSSAAVNETVKLCDLTGAGYYKALVNAVLRNIDKNRIDLDTLPYEVKYSCPQCLIDMWQKQYSRDFCSAVLESINEAPPVFAVPNPLLTNAQRLALELTLEGVSCEKDGSLVKIEGGLNVSDSNAYRNGLFHIEDKSSYECACALEAKENETVLDICSAPGGKAFTIAENMKNTGRVFAFDLYEHRVKLIEDGARRLNLKNIKTSVNDAQKLNPDIPEADKILCDVPCSGFGVIRRKPEIRYKNPDEISELPEIQYNILKTSSFYLKPGGNIIYSTCTLNKKENEQVVKRFLDENKMFSLLKENTVIPSRDGGDGFYFALMKRTD